MGSKGIRNVFLGISVAGLISAGSLFLTAQNAGAESATPARSGNIASEQSKLKPSTKINNPSATKEMCCDNLNPPPSTKNNNSPLTKGKVNTGISAPTNAAPK